MFVKHNFFILNNILNFVQYLKIIKMNSMLAYKDLKIGDKVTDIDNGRICSTYPLSDFNNYNHQPRNNNIKDGVIIDITPECATLKTLLVENSGTVCCVRVY